MDQQELERYRNILEGDWYCAAENKTYCFMTNFTLFVQDHKEMKHTHIYSWGLVHVPELSIVVYIHDRPHEVELHLDNPVPKMTILRSDPTHNIHLIKDVPEAHIKPE
jgi:hypothetical protein